MTQKKKIIATLQFYLEQTKELDINTISRELSELTCKRSETSKEQTINILSCFLPLYVTSLLFV